MYYQDPTAVPAGGGAKSTFEGKVLPAVRECAHVAENPGLHLPVSRCAPDSIGTEDFDARTRAVLRKIS